MTEFLHLQSPGKRAALAITLGAVLLGGCSSENAKSVSPTTLQTATPQVETGPNRCPQWRESELTPEDLKTYGKTIPGFADATRGSLTNIVEINIKNVAGALEGIAFTEDKGKVYEAIYSTEMQELVNESRTVYMRIGSKTTLLSGIISRGKGSKRWSTPVVTNIKDKRAPSGESILLEDTVATSVGVC